MRIRMRIFGCHTETIHPQTLSDQHLLGADDGIRTRDPHLGKVMGSPLTAAEQRLPWILPLAHGSCGPRRLKVGWQNVGKPAPTPVAFASSQSSSSCAPSRPSG